MTAAALPAGLVSHTDNVSSELGRFGTVDVEVVAKLWRVYATNKAALEKSAGGRLENLLWRIWSSSRLCSAIDGAKLARLFLRISDDNENQNAGANPAASSRFPPSSQKSNSRFYSSQSPHKQHPQRRLSHEKKKTSLPPPILKKSRAVSDEQPKNERVLFLDVNYDQNAATKSSGTGAPALPPQTTIPSGGPRVVGNIKTASLPRKRTTFTTSLAALEESPLSRRSSAESTPQLPQTEQMQPQPGIRHDYPPQNAIERYAQEENEIWPFQNPVNPANNRKNNVDSSGPQDNPSKSKSPAKSASNPPPSVQAPQTAALVEKDFRSKFVEKQQQQHQHQHQGISGSSTSNPALSADYISNSNEDAAPSTFSPHRSASSPIPVTVQACQQSPSSFSTSKLSATSNLRRSTSLSRSSSAKMPSTSTSSSSSPGGPAQSQLSKLLERNRETSSQQ